MTNRTLNEQQQKVLDVLFGSEAKGSLRKAMDIAGYSSGYSVKMFSAGLEDEIAEATKKFISSQASTKAAYTMYSALELEDRESLIGLKERIAAAKDLMGRAGLNEVQKVEVTSKSPLFILPPKDNDDTE